MTTSKNTDTNAADSGSINMNLDRRSFLKTAAIGTGGLIVSFYIPSGLPKVLAQAAAGIKIEPNAFIQIAPDNTVTVYINKLEMGQGVFTSMAQLLAEELDCEWKSIRSMPAPVAAVHNNPFIGSQMAGGSTAIASSWDQHRRIGASMRMMLLTAAAEKWKVPVSELTTEGGYILHTSKGKISYGEIADLAAKQKLPDPQSLKLKHSSEYKIIGKSVPRVDAAAKSTGRAEFGLDVRTPGMLYVMVARAPGFGAKLKSVQDAEARKISGVTDVIRLDNSVAVLAKNTFAAKQGRDALRLEWDESAGQTLSDVGIMKSYIELANAAEQKTLKKYPLRPTDKRGAGDAKIKRAAKVINADYEFPYLAHACMEPMNCTIDFDGKKATIWSGIQMQTIDRMTASQYLGISPNAIDLKTTFAGGSFGRRANKNSDYVVEACIVAKRVMKPIKVIWTREDDMRGGYYRPMNFHRVQVGLDAKSKLLGWKHLQVGQSVVGDSMLEGMLVKNGVDPTVVEGVAKTHYALEDFQSELIMPKVPVTTLWWRSVGHTHTAFVMETMMDELAHAMKRDAFELRRELLAKSPRHVAVLDLLKAKSPIVNGKPPKNRAYGLAIHESFNTIVGHVVEVSLDKSTGMPKLHKVWSAVHCGQVVNPDGAKTQVESAIVYGLSAALYQQIEIKAGRPQASNFHEYNVVRMNEMPNVEVHFVDSHEAPTGLGEPGLPPLAPAIANAMFALNGKRVRKLPFANA